MNFFKNGKIHWRKKCWEIDACGSVNSWKEASFLKFLILSKISMKKTKLKFHWLQKNRKWKPNLLKWKRKKRKGKRKRKNSQKRINSKKIIQDVVQQRQLCLFNKKLINTPNNGKTKQVQKINLKQKKSNKLFYQKFKIKSRKWLMIWLNLNWPT